MLVTGFNCGYILSFSNLMLVPLGWIWGIICLCVVGLYSAYANWLLAGFHFIDGKRFIRYRDLMGFLYGKFPTVSEFFLHKLTLQNCLPKRCVNIYQCFKSRSVLVKRRRGVQGPADKSDVQYLRTTRLMNHADRFLIKVLDFGFSFGP